MNLKKDFTPFAQWPQTNAEQEALIQRLSKSKIDVVSFDIFDTLIYRPFCRPRDLFRYLELKTGVPHFYENRTQAARLTRQEKAAQGVLEITLDEIYQTLGKLDMTLSNAQLSALKSIEQETEIELCRPNLDMLDFYQKTVTLKKQIVFTSDMYLPLETLEKMLHKCGYTHYDKLIVSHVDKLTKKSGQRFIGFLNMPAEKILHIGDNPVSDGLNADKNGIQTILYTGLQNPFLSTRLNKKLSKSHDLFSSFWQAQIMHQSMPNYWYAIGFQYIGPLLVHFSSFLTQKTAEKDLSKIAFMARDGQIMKQVFNTLYPDFEQTSYVFASRLMMQAALNHSSKTYLKYLSNLHLTNTSFALVDVGRNGTLQKNLNTFFEKMNISSLVNGYYVDLRKTDPMMHGYFQNQPKKYKRFLDFLDFLMIADHSLIMDIQEKNNLFEPIYLKPDIDEYTRETIAIQMHQGAVDFARKIIPFKNLDLFFLTPQNLLSLLNCFMNFSSIDKKAFQGITIPFGLRNEKKRFVVAPHFPLKKWLKEPFICFKIYRKALIK